VLRQGAGPACIASSSRHRVELDAPAPGRRVGEMMIIGAYGLKELTQCGHYWGQDQGDEWLQWTGKVAKQHPARFAGVL